MNIDKSKAKDTKHAILYSALEVFSEKGYDSSSISEISSNANVTKGALYWHFKDKHDLYQELIKFLTREITDQAQILASDAESPLTRMRKFNKNLLELMHNNVIYQDALLLFLKEMRRERISDLQNIIDNMKKEFNIDGIFQEAIDAKEISDMLSTGSYLELYKSVFTSLIIRWLIEEKSFDLLKVGEKYFDYIFRVDLQKENK